MKIGVLALQGNFREHIATLAGLGVEAVEVRKPEQLEGLDGLIVPGGESTAIGRLIGLYSFGEPLKRFPGAMFGTCAGMILMGRDGLIGKDGCMSGLIAYGAYVPYNRLERSEIAAVLGSAPSGGGSRAVASYDEDTTSMAVEAARIALRSPSVPRPQRVLFATADPAYLDKTNATVIHASTRSVRRRRGFRSIPTLRAIRLATIATLHCRTDLRPLSTASPRGGRTGITPCGRIAVRPATITPPG